MKNTSPYGAEKVKFSMTDDMIRQLSPIEWKPQTVSIPVSKDAINKFIQTDKSILNVLDTSTVNSNAITFRMNPTIEIGGIKGIRIQDIVVKDIVENNVGDRPIYFASTCSHDCYIGMGDYLKVEGLASRLIPVK